MGPRARHDDRRVLIPALVAALAVALTTVIPSAPAVGNPPIGDPGDGPVDDGPTVELESRARRPGPHLAGRV